MSSRLAMSFQGLRKQKAGKKKEQPVWGEGRLQRSHGRGGGSRCQTIPSPPILRPQAGVWAETASQSKRMQAGSSSMFFLSDLEGRAAVGGLPPPPSRCAGKQRRGNRHLLCSKTIQSFPANVSRLKGMTAGEQAKCPWAVINTIRQNAFP